MALILIDEDILEELVEDHRQRGDFGLTVKELKDRMGGSYSAQEIEHALKTMERGDSIRRFTEYTGDIRWMTTGTGRGRYFRQRRKEK
jgi:DNA-binding Lrp family transcriptional regulator